MAFSFPAKFAGAPLIAALPILASNLLGNLLALTHKPAAADIKRGAKPLP